MKAWCYSLVLIFFVTSTSHAQKYEDIIFGVPNFKPFTYSENGQLKGDAIIKVKEALEQVDVSYRIEQYETYTALIKALKGNDIQGFFLATKNPERDKYARFSKAVDYNNWAWFYPKGKGISFKSSEFKHSAVIGTVQKTNTYRWLVRQGYQAIGEKRENLPSLLISGSLSAVFMAEKVFEDACKDQNINPDLFNKKIEQQRDFGIYISKQYLLNQPDFLDNLNQYIAKP